MSQTSGVYVSGGFSEPMTAQHNFANQYDLDHPQEAMSVYAIEEDDLRQPRDGFDFDVTSVWSTPPTELHQPYNPHFGSQASTLSWLDTPMRCSRHVQFVTLAAPLANKRSRTTSAESAEPAVFHLDHPELPAMYAAGVYDYDEGLGIGVFGNAYGELVLFNLTGIDPHRLVSCFLPIAVPNSAGHELLPKVLSFYRLLSTSNTQVA